MQPAHLGLRMNIVRTFFAVSASMSYQDLQLTRCCYMEFSLGGDKYPCRKRPGTRGDRNRA
jgi:hypothetical protein